jgi:hypothetical protein
MQRFGWSEFDRQELLETVNTEVSFYIGMLYFVVQVFKGDEDFGDELSASSIAFVTSSLLTRFISEPGFSATRFLVQHGCFA